MLRILNQGIIKALSAADWTRCCGTGLHRNSAACCMNSMAVSVARGGLSGAWTGTCAFKPKPCTHTTGSVCCCPDSRCFLPLRVCPSINRHRARAGMPGAARSSSDCDGWRAGGCRRPQTRAGTARWTRRRRRSQSRGWGAWRSSWSACTRPCGRMARTCSSCSRSPPSGALSISAATTWRSAA